MQSGGRGAGAKVCPSPAHFLHERLHKSMRAAARGPAGGRGWARAPAAAQISSGSRTESPRLASRRRRGALTGAPGGCGPRGRGEAAGARGAGAAWCSVRRVGAGGRRPSPLLARPLLLPWGSAPRRTSRLSHRAASRPSVRSCPPSRGRASPAPSPSDPAAGPEQHRAPPRRSAGIRPPRAGESGCWAASAAAEAARRPGAWGADPLSPAADLLAARL